MRDTVILISILLATSAFAGKEGAPRTREPGILGRITGVSLRWRTVPLGDGNRALRADVYRRAPDGTFTLRRTIVHGTHKSGVKFSNERTYVPIEGRARYVPAERLREQGIHRSPVERAEARQQAAGPTPGGLAQASEHLGKATDGFVRSMNMLMAILDDRVDQMHQTTTPKGRPSVTRSRYGFKDATVETSAKGSEVELPFRVVK